MGLTKAIQTPTPAKAAFVLSMRQLIFMELMNLRFSVSFVLQLNHAMAEKLTTAQS
jgi:hypothetical protein